MFAQPQLLTAGSSTLCTLSALHLVFTLSSQSGTAANGIGSVLEMGKSEDNQSCWLINRGDGTGKYTPRHCGHEWPSRVKAFHGAIPGSCGGKKGCPRMVACSSLKEKHCERPIINTVILLEL